MCESLRFPSCFASATNDWTVSHSIRLNASKILPSPALTQGHACESKKGIASVSGRELHTRAGVRERIHFTRMNLLCQPLCKKSPPATTTSYITHCPFKVKKQLCVQVQAQAGLTPIIMVAPPPQPTYMNAPPCLQQLPFPYPASPLTHTSSSF